MNKPKTLADTYNYLLPGDPDNPKPYAICGAKTRNEEARGPHCLRPAGAGTDHVGMGRCKLHGGCNKMGIDANAYKHGRYTKVLPARIKILLEQMQADDDDNPLELKPELDMQKMLLALALQRLDAGKRQRSTNVQSNGHGSESVGSSNSVSSKGDTGGARTLDDKGYLIDIAKPEFFSFPEPDRSEFTLYREEDIQLIRDCLNDIIQTNVKITALHNQTALTKAEIVTMMTLIQGAITRFVPKENRGAFVRYLMDNVPAVKPEVYDEVINANDP